MKPYKAALTTDATNFPYLTIITINFLFCKQINRLKANKAMASQPTPPVKKASKIEKHVRQKSEQQQRHNKLSLHLQKPFLLTPVFAQLYGSFKACHLILELVLRINWLKGKDLIMRQRERCKEVRLVLYGFVLLLFTVTLTIPSLWPPSRAPEAPQISPPQDENSSIHNF